MTIIRDLYARFRQMIHEAAKFGVIGIIGVIITDGGTNLLRVPLGGWLKANIVATILATAFAYVGSRYWTFRHRERTHSTGRETVLFFVLNGIGLGIQLACLGFTNYALGLTDKFSSNVALLIGIILGTLFRFWSYRQWVWTRPQDAQPSATEDETIRGADPAAALALPEPLEREPETVPPGRGDAPRDEAGHLQ
ncbi:MAG: GtrA family protein [Streptosporangiaceae bacterium]